MNLSSQQLAADVASLNSLKTLARANQGAAAKETAKQFESLMVQMMVKSMRQASLGEGIMDSQQSLFYRDMYDQQLALHLSGKGLGLAETIERQLTGGQANSSKAPPKGKDLAYYQAHRVPTLKTAEPKAFKPGMSGQTLEQGASVAAAAEAPKRLDSVDQFVAELWPAAQDAAAELGVSPQGLIAQAALETGWGRHMIRGEGGKDSYNLFGIKAGGRWQGERANVSTLEYENGVAVRRKDYFRAYPSYHQCFADYVALIRDNPRYQKALSASNDAAYFSALQQAGYATDPNYAGKVLNILNSAPMRAALDAAQGKSS